MNIQKQDILSKIQDKDDKILLSNIYDKLENSKQKNYSIYSDFLDDRQVLLVERCFSFLKERLAFFGGFIDAKRQICYYDFSYFDVPIKILKISNLDKKKVGHRNVLGSIMSLGIIREKIGDIIVDDFVYIAVKEEIANYIIENLDKISNYHINILIIDDYTIQRVDDFVEQNTTVSSMRLDCIVSAITNLSREKAKNLILSGIVIVNYVEMTDYKKTIAENDVISMKRYGKFIVDKINGTTKKDRLRIVVKKYK